MQTINHGIPSHKYFSIAQPPYPHKYSEMLGKKFVIHNPKNDQECNAELVDLWDLKINELPDSFCLLSYGLPKEKLLPVLYKKYPAIHQKQRIHFYLLKKID